MEFDSASDFMAATDFRRSALIRHLRVGVIDCMILAVAARHGIDVRLLSD